MLTSDDGSGAAGGLDLLLGRRRERLDGHLAGDRDVALSEDLDRLTLAGRALGDQVVDRHGPALREQLAEAVQVHDLELDPEGVLEPLQLRQAHVQGQLAALEVRRHLVASLGALGATAGRLALGALTATDPGLGRLGPRSGTQVVQFQRHDLLDFLDRHQVTDGLDHATDLRAVLLDDHVADALETERAQGLALVRLAADGALELLDLQLGHQCDTPSDAVLMPSAAAFSSAAGATCSTGRPRRAATVSGCSSIRSAATVAWTMLIWLDEPSDLLSTSWMPAHSRTARTGPPAMTPGPGAAGRSMTTPAAFSPWTG